MEERTETEIEIETHGLHFDSSSKRSLPLPLRAPPYFAFGAFP